MDAEDKKLESEEVLPEKPHVVRTFALDEAQATGNPVKPKERQMVFSAPKVSETVPQVQTPVAEVTARDQRVTDREQAIVSETTEFVKESAASSVATDLSPDIDVLLEKKAPVEVPAPSIAPPTPETPHVAVPSPIHTYKSDFAERVKVQSASPFSVIAAEMDATKKPAPLDSGPASEKKATLIGVGLLVLALVIAVSAYWFSTRTQFVPLIADVPSLIFADEKYELKSASDDALQAEISGLRTQSFSKNVILLYANISTTTELGETILTTGGKGTFTALGFTAPDILVRNIGDKTTLGLARSQGLYYPFFVLDVTHFERTFAGMLDFEPSIQRELSFAYPLQEVSVTNERGVTERILIEPAPRFVDEVVSSHDVRVLYDVQGKIVMLWGYKDKQTLIITRDKESFEEILSRVRTTVE
jgi:hypothetical protein